MNSKILVSILVALLLGVGGGYWLASNSADRTSSISSAVVPTKKGGSEMVVEPGLVVIDPVTVQDIGVRTALVTRKTITRKIKSVGRVAYDEKRIARLHPKVNGWIDNLQVDETGTSVSEGQILLSIYSPRLVATEEEYLLALDNYQKLKDSSVDDIRRGAKELVDSSRDRLRLFDVPDHQISELEKTRKAKKYLHIHSPFNGIVVNIGARDGQYVTADTELFKIADLSRVWVYVDVYEYELSWVNIGDEAKITLAAMPGEIFTGKLTYIYPYLEENTRTIKVRLEFDNQDYKLKPNMFADVTIQSGEQVNALVVPSQAVLHTGNRDIVLVVRGAGKYLPREVNLGVDSEGLVQIISGLQEGEEIVTSAQFLIDSESKLREAASKMMEVRKPSSGNPRPSMMPAGDEPVADPGN